MANLAEYLRSLNRRDKTEPIPGTVEAYLEDLCPACGKRLMKSKPCCGHPNGHVTCSDPTCGYKEG